jgi:imidazolonepropionase
MMACGTMSIRAAKSYKIFEDIAELLSLEGAAAKAGRRIGEADLSIIQDAAMVSVGGEIKWIGRRDDLNPQIVNSLGQDPEHISLGGRTVMPAFVEPHTHLVFGGSRAHEFEWRMQGQTYQEISAKGGGILSTVKATRAMDEDDLLKLAQARADRFVAQGVTLLEVKSGYGQDSETEIKSLKVARRIQGPDVVTTYLGPHSRSPEHPDLESYMRQICNEVLPRIAREKLADRADIYIEKGFYSTDLARDYFEALKAVNLPFTAHVEQLSDFGGTALALDYHPQSVDHVVYIGPEVIARLAKSETTAVLLPTSDFYLKMRYPPARALIDAGARVALSTDFNPGTSPTQDLGFVGVLARLEMKMSLCEVISAFTLGGAYSLGRYKDLGSLQVGKRCDFVVLDGVWRDIFYSVGHHPVNSVWKAGLLLK